MFPMDQFKIINVPHVGRLLFVFHSKYFWEVLSNLDKRN